MVPHKAAERGRERQAPSSSKDGKGIRGRGLGVRRFIARMSAMKQHFSEDLGQRKTDVFARHEGSACKNQSVSLDHPAGPRVRGPNPSVGGEVSHAKDAEEGRRYERVPNGGGDEKVTPEAEAPISHRGGHRARG